MTLKPYSKLPTLAHRKPDAHKGDSGRVWVVAGSPGLTGAAYLAAQAAARTGSGMVTLAVPRALEPILEMKTTSVMTRGLVCTKHQQVSEFSFSQIVEGTKHIDALAFGPGLGTGKSTQRLLTKILPVLDMPLVIDADGLNLLAQDVSRLKGRVAPTILTPHPGEMARLCGSSVDEIQQDRSGIAAKFAKRHGVIVLLKGPDTVVTDGENLYTNETGNAGLASAGSGDVLTGMVISLIGQGLSALDAAILGAYLHGLAGDMAISKEKGPFLAQKLLKYIGVAVETYFQDQQLSEAGTSES